MYSDLVPLIALPLALVILDLAAHFYGRDSRRQTTLDPQARPRRDI
jgi:hypothetical protein